MMRVLDLFSGLEGWSQPFKERGHEVVTLDLEPSFGADLQRDFLQVASLRDIDDGRRYDVVLSSPPCESFSTGSFRHHHEARALCECGEYVIRLSGEVWSHRGHGIIDGTKTFKPKTKRGELGVNLLLHTFALIRDYQPAYWLVENPRAMARNYAPVDIPRATVTWCQYGDYVMKPTDLWGSLPERFSVRACKNGDTCHESAPRGAKTGTQGKSGSAERGKIPRGLALEMCIALEESV